MSSEPNAPTGNSGHSPVGASFTRAPSLDVAGEQTEDDVVARGQGRDQLGDSGHHAHARAVTDGRFQLGDIRRVTGREAGGDPRVVEPGAAHEIRHDARVGLAAKVVGIDRDR